MIFSGPIIMSTIVGNYVRAKLRERGENKEVKTAWCLAGYNIYYEGGESGGDLEDHQALQIRLKVQCLGYYANNFVFNGVMFAVLFKGSIARWFRASALQAEGPRFEPVCSHKKPSVDGFFILQPWFVKFIALAILSSWSSSSAPPKRFRGTTYPMAAKYHMTPG